MSIEMLFQKYKKTNKMGKSLGYFFKVEKIESCIKMEEMDVNLCSKKSLASVSAQSTLKKRSLKSLKYYFSLADIMFPPFSRSKTLAASVS